MANKKIKVAYAEPDDYFPKEIRKEFKLGEYAEDAKKPKKVTSKTETVKKKVKRTK